LHVVDVNRLEAARPLRVRRLVMPSYGLESWTLIGPDLRPVDEYLAWLTHNERSPNTIEAYAFDLKAPRSVLWKSASSPRGRVSRPSGLPYCARRRRGGARRRSTGS
jgi:hypothetical protein